MNKCLLLFLILGSWSLLTQPIPTSEAKEDTAHMVLRKTAGTGKTTQEYVVRKGDSIDRIVKQFLKNSAHRYTLIRELNPDLKDLHRIYPGQTILLPVLAEEGKESVAPAPAQNGQVVPYQVKKGDSIIRILKHQLKLQEAEAHKALRIVSQVNPGLKDLSRISIGQTIMLPAISLLTSSPAVQPEQNAEKIRVEIKPILPPDKDMALLKQLLGRSHGNLNQKGSYFLPLPQMGRVTIDCSAIPVVEFDDGSTILLDFGNRIPDSLQRLIKANWKNYSVLKVKPSQDIFLILQEIMNASGSYSMRRGLKPILLERNPQVLINLDWIITTKNPTADRPSFHGILLVSDKTRLLPGQIRQYASQKGFQFTEVVNGEISFPPPADKSPPTLQPKSIDAVDRMDLIFNLLTELGYSPARNQEIRLLDNSSAGFHLSLKPDILLKTESREILMFTKKPPRQFLEVLSKQKKEVLLVNTRLSKKANLSQVLSALSLPDAFDKRYAFYIAERGRKATITVTLSALKIERPNRSPLFLVDCSLDPNLYSLLHKDWNVELVQY